MCDATVIMVAGLVVGAYGSYQQAQGQKAQARYQAQVAKNNAQAAEWQAKDAQERGEQAAMENRRKYARLAGTQRATLASRGLDIGDGSALAILSDTELFGEMDTATIRNNAAREAWGYRAQGTNSMAQAGLYAANADSISPGFAAGSTLLSGAGTVADRWYKSK